MREDRIAFLANPTSTYDLDRQIANALHYLTLVNGARAVSVTVVRRGVRARRRALLDISNLLGDAGMEILQRASGWFRASSRDLLGDLTVTVSTAEDATTTRTTKLLVVPADLLLDLPDRLIAGQTIVAGRGVNPDHLAWLERRCSGVQRPGYWGTIPLEVLLAAG